MKFLSSTWSAACYHDEFFDKFVDKLVLRDPSIRGKLDAMLAQHNKKLLRSDPVVGMAKPSPRQESFSAAKRRPAFGSEGQSGV